MKKLTASIFASLLTVVTVGAANANIASQGYVDEKVGTVSDTVTTLSGRVSTNEGNITALQTEKANKTDLGALASKDTVSAADIDANAVTTEKIANGNVTKAKLEAGVQTSLGLADTALQKGGQLTQGNLLTTDASGNIVDAGAKGALASKDTVSAAEIAANAVTTEKILDANVTKAKLASDVQASLDLADKALQKAAADAAYAVKSTEETAATASTNAQQALTNIGTLTTLTTDANTNTVVAINEVASEAAAAQTAADSAQSDVDALGVRVDTAEGEIDGIQTQLGTMATSATIGNLQNLTTTEKTNLVGAINEVDADASDALENAATAQSAAETAQAAAEAAQETADAAIPAPSGECADPINKCVLTYNNSTYAWEVISRGDAE